MTFDQYFEENFKEVDSVCHTKTLSLNKKGHRLTPIDKGDLKDLWDAAIESVDKE